MNKPLQVATIRRILKQKGIDTDLIDIDAEVGQLPSNKLNGL